MDRSFAGRLGLGAAPSRTTRRPARRRPGRRHVAPPRGGSVTGVDRAIALLWRLPGVLTRRLALAWRLLGAHRRLRAVLVAALLVTPALVGGWLWLRHSSLVAVRHVRVIGAHGGDAAAIDSALTAAARRMSTLDVNTGALREAVAGYPIVGSVQAHASFPHGLTIRVIEQPPVAVATFNGTRTALAGDGVVLGPAHASASLPTLAAKLALTPGEHIHSATLLAALSVLGAAPPPLAHKTVRAYESSKGLTVALQGGLVAYFGDASRPHAKWLALARVLADAGSAGATYVDVRVPERPAAGFAPGVSPPSVGLGEAEAEGSATPSASESSQSLAEGLSSAVGGRAGQPATSPAESSSGEARAASGESSSRESAAASGESTSGEATGTSSESEGVRSAEATAGEPKH